MSSSRISLILLAIIFLAVVVISSGKIIQNIRNKVPFLAQQSKTESGQSTPAPSVNPSVTKTAHNTNTQEQAVSPAQTPETGPNDWVYILLGGGLAAGLAVNKVKVRRK